MLLNTDLPFKDICVPILQSPCTAHYLYKDENQEARQKLFYLLYCLCAKMIFIKVFQRL